MEEDLLSETMEEVNKLLGDGGEMKMKSCSIRLKSALRQWKDYMKNRGIQRQVCEIENLYDVDYREDNVTLLKDVWDVKDSIFQEPSQFCLWFDKYFPSYDDDYMEIFLVEMKMMCGGKRSLIDMMDIRQVIREKFRYLPELACFLTVIVSINTSADVIDQDMYPWGTRVINGVLWSKFNRELSIGVRKDLALIRLGKVTTLVHRDHLLNICDKVNERMNVLIFSHISLKFLSSNMLCNLDDLDFLFLWGDSIIKRWGSRGFLLLSNYEALMVGMILRKGDEELWDCHKFLNNVIEDLVSEDSGFKDKIMELLNVVSGWQVDKISDAHGLYRIWGHPEVSLEDGLKKMYSTSMTKKSYNEENLKNAERNFKEMFYVNYYKKHGHYPRFNITANQGESYGSYVLSCLQKNEVVDRRRYEYALLDWDRVEICKTFEVPGTWNLAHNIKDKAISPDRDELISSIRKGKGVIIQEDRRTVLKWLSKNMIPMRDFLDWVDKNGLPINSLIIGLYAKERELKWFPRYFSLMSFYLRLYFVSTEQLLSDNLLQYFPQITMTSNLLEMTKKILKMSGKQGVDAISKDTENPVFLHKEVSFSINIDFKKWNQQMRYTTTERIFHCIDKSFGFDNLYRRTHKLLEGSFIYLCSGESVPEVSGDSFIPDYPWSWEGDESGKEGLRQKGWTIITVCMIDFILKSHDVEFQLIGGGDNQVLIITLKTELVDDDGKMTPEGKNDLKGRVRRIINDMDEYFSSVGLPLKVNETWVSPDLFAYNKILCFRGTLLRSCSKTVSRTFPFSDDAAITLSGMASSIGTSLKSIPSRDFSHLPTYVYSRWIALWLSFISYVAHPTIQGGIAGVKEFNIEFSFQNQKCSHVIKNGEGEPFTSLLNALLFWHRVLGGCSLGVPSDWVMRGFPDPLTSALSWNISILKEISLSNKLRRTILCSISMSKKAGTPEYLHIISDPVSINHDAPLSGVAVLRELSERAIVESDRIGNHEFKELARMCHSEQSKILIRSLVSSNILEPRFLHDIFGATLYGYFNSIVSRVDKSMTIMRLNQSENVLWKIQQNEIKYLGYIIYRSQFPFDIVPDNLPCSRVLSDLMREYSWEKKICGVTVPSPVEYFSHMSSSFHLCDDNFVLVNSIPHDFEERNLGPLFPYLGSYTDEKFKLTPIAGAFGEENLLKKAIHLQKLRHWRYQPWETHYQLICDVLKSETNLDPDNVFVWLESSSSAVHRYSDAVLSHGAILNANPDNYRWFSISTSTLSKRSKGGRNDMIHFQASLIWILSFCVNSTWSVEKYIKGHVHETCTSCIVEINEPTVNDSEIKIPWGIPRLLNNQLAYVDQKDIMMDYAQEMSVYMYSVIGGLTVTVEDAYKPDVYEDSVAQDFFSTLINKGSMTESNIRSMGEIANIRPVMRKLKWLIQHCEERDRKDLSWSNLTSLVTSPGVMNLLREENVCIKDWGINKQNSNTTISVLLKLMDQIDIEECMYYTNFKIPLINFSIAKQIRYDPSLRKCAMCLKDYKIKISTTGKIRQQEYGCTVHFKRKIRHVVFCIIDGYQSSKHMRGEVLRLNIRCPERQIMVGYWNSINVAPVSDRSWRPIYSNALSELIAVREYYGLFCCLEEIFMREEGRNTKLIIIVDSCWDHVILAIYFFVKYSVTGHVSTYLSSSSTSNNDACSFVGIKEFLPDEYKKYLELTNEDDEPQDECRRVQIITGSTKNVFSSDSYIFPLCSNKSLWVIRNHVKSGYSLLYPRKNVDKSLWCLAIKHEKIWGDLLTLYSMRSSLRSRRIDKRMRSILDEEVRKISYPISLSYDLVTFLPSLSSYVTPKNRLDSILNAQTLLKTLRRDVNRRGRFLDGKDKQMCMIWIALFATTMKTHMGIRLIEHICDFSFINESDDLVIKRRRSKNRNLLSLYDMIREERGSISFIPYSIFDFSVIHLNQSSLRSGIHVYNFI